MPPIPQEVFYNIGSGALFFALEVILILLLVPAIIRNMEDRRLRLSREALATKCLAKGVDVLSAFVGVVREGFVKKNLPSAWLTLDRFSYQEGGIHERLLGIHAFAIYDENAPLYLTAVDRYWGELRYLLQEIVFLAPLDVRALGDDKEAVQSLLLGRNPAEYAQRMTNGGADSYLPNRFISRFEWLLARVRSFAEHARLVDAAYKRRRYSFAFNDSLKFYFDRSGEQRRVRDAREFVALTKSELEDLVQEMTLSIPDLGRRLASAERERQRHVGGR